VDSEDGVGLVFSQYPIETMTKLLTSPAATSVVVGNRPSVKWGIGSEGDGLDYYYVPLSNNKTLIITRRYTYNNNLVSVQVFDEMLKTLKVEDPIGWNTCVNSKYAYEVKYPQTWKTWKPGQGEATEASCESGSGIITFSPNIFSSLPEVISIDVSNPERLSGTIYKGINSLDEYFNRNPEILKSYPKIKETLLSGEKLVWLNGGSSFAFLK